VLISSKAIVLKHFKYSENSIICKIYTEELGIKSYLINNLRSKKGQNKMAWFQPLTLLDLIVYNKEKKQLQHIKEASCSQPLLTLHCQVHKSSMALFVAEILLKTIKEEEANPVLFAFIAHFINALDKAETNYADFHLIFMLHLTQYLGFYPKAEPYTPNAYFDMIEGKFSPGRPLHSTFIDSNIASHFYNLLNADYTHSNTLNLNGKLRNLLLENIIMYYKTHLEGIGIIHSAEVLKMVFEGK